MAQWVKNLPGDARDTGEAGLIPGLRRSPGEGVATHPSIVAWTMPWTEEPDGYSPWGCQKESETTEANEHAHGQQRRRNIYYLSSFSLWSLLQVDGITVEKATILGSQEALSI